MQAPTLHVGFPVLLVLQPSQSISSPSAARNSLAVWAVGCYRVWDTVLVVREMVWDGRLPVQPWLGYTVVMFQKVQNVQLKTKGLYEKDGVSWARYEV